MTATSDKHLETLAKDTAKTGGPSVFMEFNQFHAPPLLAAPEAIQGSPHPYSPPINIWAVGHLVRGTSLTSVQRADQRRADAIPYWQLFQCLTGGETVYTKRVERMGLEFPDSSEYYTPPGSLHGRVVAPV